MNSYGHNILLFLPLRVGIVAQGSAQSELCPCPVAVLSKKEANSRSFKVNCVPVLSLYLVKRKQIAGLLSSAVVVAQGQQGGNIYALEAV